MSLTRQALEFRRVMRDVGTVATRDTVALMALVRESSFDRGMELMRETLPAISKTYGSVTETVTRTYYQTQRQRAQISTPFVAPPVDYDWDLFADNTVGFAGSRIAERSGYGATVALVAGAVTGELNAFSRIIIEEYSSMDPTPTSFQRVTGPDPCEFCLFMAAVADARRFATSEGSVDYHNKCSCVDVPVFQGQSFDRPASYDRMEETFGEARSHLEITQALAREQAPGLRRRDFFRKYPDSSITTKNIMREIRAVDGGKPFTVRPEVLGANPERTVRNAIARNPQWSDSQVAMARSLL